MQKSATTNKFDIGFLQMSVNSTGVAGRPSSRCSPLILPKLSC
jgi:hypothetical protein